MKIIWLIGQPSSGKTSLAKKFLSYHTTDWFHVDGDDIRKIFNNTDYSKEGRIKNIDVAQKISEYLYNQGKNVIVSLVTPYSEQRELFKEKIGDDIIEVYLFSNDDRGRNNYYVNNFEIPKNNYYIVDTTNKTIEESYNLFIDKIKDKLNIEI
jgi:adenylylsulfate kinase-like enzyme